LLTAFALGAIFLGLALIANSAIFTENLATRNENVESTDALEYRYSVTQATGEIVAFANEYNHTSHDEITANVEQGIRDMSAYTGIQQVERGAAVSLALAETTNGSRIFQDDGSNFTDNRSAENWTLADGIENTRAFALEITNVTGTFSVVANDTDSPVDEWRLDISSDELTVTQPDVPGSEQCSYDTPGTVAITDAMVNDSPCPALVDTESGDPMHFAAGIDGEYAIEFEGGDTVKGNYSLVIEDGSDGTVGGLADKHYGDTTGPGESPYVVPAMYSVTLDVAYDTSRLSYRTDVTVARGEPP
jgi:hypothetical protein